MKIDANVRRAAAETAQLAAVFGSGSAADEVIEAAQARAERLVTQRIIDRLQLLALASERDDLDTKTLVWFATELDQELGPDGRVAYDPQDGDVVQVTMTGVINEYEISGQDKGKMWDLISAEGVTLSLFPEDLETLSVIKLA